jgi:hypothetical protein
LINRTWRTWRFQLCCLHLQDKNWSSTFLWHANK